MVPMCEWTGLIKGGPCYNESSKETICEKGRFGKSSSKSFEFSHDDESVKSKQLARIVTNCIV